ncbi:MAG: DivIVA domain-containing protein [Eubacteriaceae bacterium]|nr:DivIVA domain-containing protein [Eubacteriaceae bacterium]
MMITPLDIQNKQFTKGMRGYKEDEVDMFLDLITLDLEKVIKENAKLKADVSRLEEEMKKYKGSEGEVVKVLEQAQKLMGDISQSAEKRAEVILKNAEMDAELAIRESRDQAQRLVEEHRNLKNRYESFRDGYKRMLEDELSRFDKMDEDMYPNFNENKLEEILEGVSEVPDREDDAERSAGFSTEISDETRVDIDFSETDDDRKTMVIDMKNGGGE